jgi:hypothetical protein
LGSAAENRACQFFVKLGMAWDWFLVFALGPDIVLGSMPQKAPPQLPQRLLQLTPLHFVLVHVSVYISKAGLQRANVIGHLPPPGPRPFAFTLNRKRAAVSGERFVSPRPSHKRMQHGAKADIHSSEPSARKRPTIGFQVYGEGEF